MDGWLFRLARLSTGMCALARWVGGAVVYIWVKASTPWVGISNEEKKDEGDCRS
jgi:hypothetical protein